MVEERERTLTVKEAAKVLECSEQYVREGLKRKILNIGTAIQLSDKDQYTYHISKKLVSEYIGDFEESSYK